jgi:hypothetical protein
VLSVVVKVVWRESTSAERDVRKKVILAYRRERRCVRALMKWRCAGAGESGVNEPMLWGVVVVTLVVAFVLGVAVGLGADVLSDASSGIASMSLSLSLSLDACVLLCAARRTSMILRGSLVVRRAIVLREIEIELWWWWRKIVEVEWRWKAMGL